MLPTLLTLLRILLSFLIVVLLLIDSRTARLCALGLFLVAAVTDWLDGYLARRWRQSSGTGALLDPIADKILVLGLLVALAYLGVLPGWMVLLIAGREVLVTAVRLLALTRHVVLAAAAEGKQKTVSQMVTIVVAFLAIIVDNTPSGIPDDASPGLLWRMAILSLWVTLVLTLVSGGVFFRRHWGVVCEILRWR